jgi:hypothetical protein
MRTEQALAKKGSKNRLAGAVMGLALVSGALLFMDGAFAKHATYSIEAVKPAAAESASTTPDRISPGEAIADRDVLDLQLD